MIGRLMEDSPEGLKASMRHRFAIAALLTTGLCAASCASDPDLVLIHDRDLGLSKTSVFEAPAPDPVAENQADPGELPPLPRAYETAPPRVPHNVVDLLPIKRNENWCLDCHLVETKEEGEATPIPQSHFVDLRNPSNELREQIAGARYICVTCHVAPTGADPLVDNLFLPATPLAKGSN